MDEKISLPHCQTHSYAYNSYPYNPKKKNTKSTINDFLESTTEKLLDFLLTFRRTNILTNDFLPKQFI